MRGRPLPASGGRRAKGLPSSCPVPTDDLVALERRTDRPAYPLEPSAWLEEACAVAGRDLTRAEWDRYLPDRPYERTCP